MVTTFVRGIWFFWPRRHWNNTWTKVKSVTNKEFFILCVRPENKHSCDGLWFTARLLYLVLWLDIPVSSHVVLVSRFVSYSLGQTIACYHGILTECKIRSWSALVRQPRRKQSVMGRWPQSHSDYVLYYRSPKYFIKHNHSLLHLNQAKIVRHVIEKHCVYNTL